MCGVFYFMFTFKNKKVIITVLLSDFLSKK